MNGKTFPAFQVCSVLGCIFLHPDCGPSKKYAHPKDKRFARLASSPSPKTGGEVNKAYLADHQIATGAIPRRPGSTSRDIRRHSSPNLPGSRRLSHGRVQILQLDHGDSESDRRPSSASGGLQNTGEPLAMEMTDVTTVDSETVIQVENEIRSEMSGRKLAPLDTSHQKKRNSLRRQNKIVPTIVEESTDL